MSVKFINGSLLFIQNNIDDIFFVAYLLFLLSFILYYLGFSLPEDKKKEIDHVVVMESFKPDKLSLTDKDLNNYKKIKIKSFCENGDLEKKCKSLKKSGIKGCSSTNCCVWASNKYGSDCVEGNKNGPLLKKDNNLKDYDYYYYLNKRHKIE